MAEITNYDQGEFCWTELCSTDANSAKNFYKQIFGWGYDDIPIGDGVTYTMAQVESKSACALYSMDEELRKKNVPSNWLAYISVTDADAMTAKAKTAGATIITNPFDVMDVGRMAVLQDPTGATFAIWQPKKHAGAEIGGETGTVCWRELISTNVDVAAKFYGTLFGWKPTVDTYGTFNYTTLKLGDEGIGGLMPPQSPNTPSQWVTCFIVDSASATVATTKKLGGTVYLDTMAIPGIGKYAVLADPQGAVFSVMEAENA